jgi:6-phosphogluconolactonase
VNGEMMPSSNVSTDPSGDGVRVFTDRAHLCRAAALDALGILADAVQDRAVASAVLTGGGTGTGILTALADLVDRGEARVPDFSRVHLWWGDERFLPAGDPDRNEVQAQEALLAGLVARHGLPEENIHRMPAAGTALMTEAADAYASELVSHTRLDPGPDPRLPFFDVVMLGVGPDAHVASLFPGLPGPRTTGSTVIAVADSPKPPPLRISLTVEALNSAERIWFVVAGADKRDAVAAVREARSAETTDAARWPASVVSGRRATQWWLDGAAAGRS